MGFGDTYQPSPEFTLPHPASLPKQVGNNWQESVFGQSHGRKQIFQVRSGTCLEADTKDYISGVAHKLNRDEPDGCRDTQVFQETMKNNSRSHQLLDEGGPKWLSLEDKVLRFNAYVLEGTVRTVRVTFFPHDNTLMVEEDKVPNSGIQGGRFLKRHKVEVTLADLNVGNILELYKRRYYIFDCDEATRYFLESIGTYVPGPLPVPTDPTSNAAYQFGLKGQKRPKNQADRDMKVSFEQQCKGRIMTQSADDVRKTQQFFAEDGKVLMFRAIWDDQQSECGDLRTLEVKFYLGDSTIEILERLPANSGRDPQRALAARKRLPKDKLLQIESTVQARGYHIPDEQYYSPADLYVGARINLYGRIIHLVDCDNYTRCWYRDVAGVDLLPAIDVDKAFNVVKKVFVKKPPPPHNGFGTEEDSLGNCKSLALKPPKRAIKPEELDGVILRFSAVLNEAVSKTDFSRKFTLMYFLSDDTLQINEVAVRNSGQIAGRFLRRQRVKKTLNDALSPYIKWQDLRVGEVIDINCWKFLLEKSDAATDQFYQEHL